MWQTGLPVQPGQGNMDIAGRRLFALQPDQVAASQVTGMRGEVPPRAALRGGKPRPSIVQLALDPVIRIRITGTRLIARGYADE